MNTQIKFFEELGLNAWPGSHSLLIDGWMLLFTEGYSHRANSVNPMYPGDPAATLEKIRLCEDLYNSKGLPTVFKMTPASFPSELDEILASQGYVKYSPTSLQTALVSNLDTTFQNNSAGGDNKGEEVRLIAENTLKPEWLSNWLTLSGISLDKGPVAEKIMANIQPAHCFVRLEQAGQTLAMGLAVCERGHVGLFNIVSNPQLRRQGWGKRVVLELLKWGKEQGAISGYLQVSLDNAAAVPLYANLGFREVYQYWYRVKTLEKV